MGSFIGLKAKKAVRDGQRQYRSEEKGLMMTEIIQTGNEGRLLRAHHCPIIGVSVRNSTLLLDGMVPHHWY